ncbi:MAG: hypothetical protein HY525_02040 [Betaproteobacteria bacterium]|nr:hypothetical protein [Betaproteobacteria bacterium]
MPAHFSALEGSLEPGSCAACHRAQFDDWKQSLHSRAMGPGIMGQLVNMAPHATDEHQDCLRCHAPLQEQAAGLASALAQATGEVDAAARKARRARALHEQGLVCAACHLRGFQRYGPPRRDGSTPEPAAALPHNGWISSPAFEDSRFCAACHQFETGDYALNGKLLENTYQEWKASRYAREGKQCQSCHMPERRHLWRGIHDPEMVKAGVTINVRAVEVTRDGVAGTLVIMNTGTGHHFPTYVTPRIIVEAYQEDPAGKVILETLKQFVIGRSVTPDLSAELADTRIAADEEKSFDYRAPVNPKAAQLVFRVRVEPDAFYAGFYRSLLKDKQAGKGEKLIRQALRDSTASRFTIYTSRHPLQTR